MKVAIGIFLALIIHQHISAFFNHVFDSFRDILVRNRAHIGLCEILKHDNVLGSETSYGKGELVFINCHTVKFNRFHNRIKGQWN